MIWYILISLLLIFLLWLFLVPVILYTNTQRNRYLLTLPGIFRILVVPDNGLFYIRGWILFIPFKFNPFKPRKKKEKEKPRKKKKFKFARIAPVPCESIHPQTAALTSLPSTFLAMPAVHAESSDLNGSTQPRSSNSICFFSRTAPKIDILCDGNDSIIILTPHPF